uniref:Senescence domain-containing protein n=1 Tax=Echinococcus granulosus TaxID=6210 RepID=A0A068X4V8_ECHGR|nr:hypothetical protein EgrG_002050800 [Echinococcus granulosus]
MKAAAGLPPKALLLEYAGLKIARFQLTESAEALIALRGSEIVNQSHDTEHMRGGEYLKGGVLDGTSVVKKSVASIVHSTVGVASASVALLPGRSYSKCLAFVAIATGSEIVNQSHDTEHMRGGEYLKGGVLDGTSVVKKSVASIVHSTVGVASASVALLPGRSYSKCLAFVAIATNFML